MILIPSQSSVISAGDRCGRYTVLGIHKLRDGYQKYAQVRCDCGSAPRYVQIGTLRNGEAQSCGCLHKERVTKHGMWDAPLFKVWKGMIDRCTNPKNKRFPNYGARGINVCQSWLNHNNFISDMGKSYKPGLTLDRTDNNGPYSPENCRWATRSQQNRNYSRNITITHEGITMCLMDWSKALGINYGTLIDRIKIQKLPFIEAISDLKSKT